MKILIASGGSGGHIFPAVALARKLKEARGDIDILFVGSRRGLDRRIFEKEGFRFILLSDNKLPYKKSWRTLLFLAAMFLDTCRAFAAITRYGPDVSVGFGGYTSCPAIFASRILGVPTLIHEQNVVPGRANKFLFGWAGSIAISFDRTREFLGSNRGKVFLTGNPIRADMVKDDRIDGIRKLGLDEKKFTILVIGGSQGSRFLNRTFVEALSNMKDSVRSSMQVIHITGIKDYAQTSASYEKLKMEHRVYSFIDRIEEAYSASDLVVTRSGASALFELAFFAKPMVLVPYPFALSHQAENARAFAEKGGAVELEEKTLSAESFKREIEGLVTNKARLTALAGAAKRLSVPEASDNMARIVLDLASKKTGNEKRQ
jgi:UDP-N-acetylglucosamine--N-acetylmuramyl-(pentapeptide) pyrophosphoryl-undecaprenol N-acetylglucosamine transferase